MLEQAAVLGVAAADVVHTTQLFIWVAEALAVTQVTEGVVEQMALHLREAVLVVAEAEAVLDTVKALEQI